jgi:acyl-CoA dehydrogenase
MNDHRDELRRLIADIAADTPVEERSSDRLWQTLRELGLTLVGVDESRGGSGGDFADLVAVVRTLGEYASGLPVAEAALSAWVIAESARRAEAASAVPLVSDQCRLAFGMDGGYAADLSVLRITGVPWLRDADSIVVYDRTGAVSFVDLGTAGVDVRAAENLAGEPRDILEIHGTAGVALPGAPGLADVRARYALLRAAAVAGAAAGTYRLTREYVMQREQFGKPLARIPAVASGLGMMRVALVQLDAAVDRAAERVAPDGDAGLGRGGLAAVATAAVIAAETAATCARTAHQLHGAMGVTAEYPLHHFTKRLWSWPDEVGTETHSAEYLGGLALERGETAIWDELTC